MGAGTCQVLKHAPPHLPLLGDVHLLDLAVEGIGHKGWILIEPHCLVLDRLEQAFQIPILVRSLSMARQGALDGVASVPMLLSDSLILLINRDIPGSLTLR